MPLLLILMAGLMDGGRAILQQLDLQAAAQAGADYARTEGGDLDGVADAVRQATPLTVTLSPAPSRVEGCLGKDGIKPAKRRKDKCSGNTEPGEFIVVTATSPFEAIGPWKPLTWTPTLRASALVRVD